MGLGIGLGARGTHLLHGALARVAEVVEHDSIANTNSHFASLNDTHTHHHTVTPAVLGHLGGVCLVQLDLHCQGQDGWWWWLSRGERRHRGRPKYSNQLLTY